MSPSSRLRTCRMNADVGTSVFSLRRSKASASHFGMRTDRKTSSLCVFFTLVQRGVTASWLPRSETDKKSAPARPLLATCKVLALFLPSQVLRVVRHALPPSALRTPAQCATHCLPVRHALTPSAPRTHPSAPRTHPLRNRAMIGSHQRGAFTLWRPRRSSMLSPISLAHVSGPQNSVPSSACARMTSRQQA